MSSLRAEIDRIIDQHFEPSTLGRIQAVDEIMAAVDTIRPRVTAESLAGPATSGKVISDGRETFISITNAYEPSQDPPPPNSLGESSGMLSGQMWALPSEPTQSGIRLTPEARKKLLESVPGMFLDQPVLEREWRELEECLTKLLSPPVVRYVLGVDPSHDRCQRCGINSRIAGDFLCSSCRQDGDPHE